MEKKAIVCNYEIVIKGNSFQIISPNQFFSNNGLFYYSPAETKDLHRQNLKYDWSFINQVKGLYTQLIGVDAEITNQRVYTRLINLYIS